MSTGVIAEIEVFDFSPSREDFLKAVIDGLGKPRKELPCTFFYDARGSELFEQICGLEEYYPTRTELAIMREHGRAIGEELGAGCLLVEYGSGSSTKTRVLLRHLEQPAGYVPVDVSRDQLVEAGRSIRGDFPNLEVLPVCADFTRRFELPRSIRAPARTVVYFPGSSIGNFDPPAADRLLRSMADLVGKGGGLVIGIDLKKDPAVLHAAYNDSAGVTADFNLNVLIRMQRELGARVDLDAFRHYAFYNPTAGRVEMHLVSLARQAIVVGDRAFELEVGESIWTESSHKYTVQGFTQSAAVAGWDLQHAWTDRDQLLAVLLLRATDR